MQAYRVIVVGGGHAGVEAAWAAANVLGGSAIGADGPSVALVTLDTSKIGVMSCNPAIGGLAKGQLVREVDALNGLMGLATDATGIQFKVLNTSKGPAVHGPRAQCDKHAYAEEVQRLIAMRPEIELVAGSVERLVVERGELRGVVVKRAPSGEVLELHAGAVVLTTGTFMRGLMHTGERRTEGGRFGEAAAVGISGALRELGFELGRLKTGTPPRLKRGSIDWDGLPQQWGDERPAPFSDLTGSKESIARAIGGAFSEDFRAEGEEECTRSLARSVLFERFPLLPQVACAQTHTTRAVHEIIRVNLHRAPMYSGQIESVGPRYCPSIEDKVVRFAERETHGVFLEPESLRDDWVYCNGISTSLPADVQDAIVRSMPGCERAEVYRYGYAVEYDMVRPHQIRATGETKLVRNLFLAGQINGTSGYEEAAAQGLVAGVNAARRATGQGEWVLGREQAYIGVLMDDLVTKTPIEPYRMFTSRAEHRLLLRADNAADRLTPVAREVGLLENAWGRVRSRVFALRGEQMRALHAAIDAARVEGVPLGRRMMAAEFELDDLRRDLEEVGDEDIRSLARSAVSALTTVYADRRYEPYLVRQRAEIKRQAELEHRRLPENAPYESFHQMRTEARQALVKFRPATFGQAGRLEGMTPADLTLLAVLVARK
ncbi:MAG TPA: FAD-dependent oxidoreductase [Phycisphaerales bacterium]|nr:FAD-dependent oxidoreductase [Phycisphaerales bacterium]